MTDQPDAVIIAHHARLGVDPKPVDPGGVYSVLVPEGAEHTIVDLESERDAREERPRRRKGTVTAYDSDSFGELVKALGPEHGVVRLYGDPRALNLTAVLNDDQPTTDELTGAGWRDHRVSFTVQRTRAWQAWVDGEGLKDQETFAQHIEDQRADIVRPDAATMLEIAQTIEASIAAQFRQGARLKDGARQFTYHEVIDGKAGKEGTLEIPDVIGLVLVLFEGGEPQMVDARLRYRIESGRLRIGYIIPDAPDLERKAFENICDAVEAGLEQPIILGKPAS